MLYAVKYKLSFYIFLYCRRGVRGRPRRRDPSPPSAHRGPQTEVGEQPRSGARDAEGAFPRLACSPARELCVLFTVLAFYEAELAFSFVIPNVIDRVLRARLRFVCCVYHVLLCFI